MVFSLNRRFCSCRYYCSGNRNLLCKPDLKQLREYKSVGIGNGKCYTIGTYPLVASGSVLFTARFTSASMLAGTHNTA